MIKQSRYKRDEMIQRNGLRAKNDHRYLPILEVLLMLDAAIDRKHSPRLRAVRHFRARQTQHAEPSGIRVEADDFEGDEVRTRRGEPSFGLANESGLCVLQCVDGSLASDGGKILEKLI